MIEREQQQQQSFFSLAQRLLHTRQHDLEALLLCFSVVNMINLLPQQQHISSIANYAIIATTRNKE
jgi:hypothetical protein